MNEIAVAMSNGKISYNEACDFASKVLDRFRNPFLDHQWISITAQYSSKMKMRNIPLLVKHFKKNSYVPDGMALGFAAYLLFMKCSKSEKGNYVGHINGCTYPVQDDHAAYFAEKWRNPDADKVVDSILADKEFWETDLSSLNGFAEKVKMYLHAFLQNGVMSTFASTAYSKTVV
jgi:tagaturonate reductase